MQQAREREVALSWLIVSHDSAADLAALLPGLCAELAALERAGLRSELLVADNASADGSAEIARRLAPGATVIELPSNGGYGAALNRAATQARGRWLACSNADLQFAPGDLKHLPAVLATAPREAGLLGPALRDARGAWQPSAGSFPTLRRLLQRLPLPAGTRTYLPRAAHVAGRVDWVTGACLFVRAETFRSIGGFDEDFFLYYEDVDLAARALQRGWTVHYAPAVCACHVHPHAARPRQPHTEGHVRLGRELWFERHRPLLERRLLGLLMRVEPLLRGETPPRGADRSGAGHPGAGQSGAARRGAGHPGAGRGPDAA
jgi:N-acetylglucosaminyl-diphospho-decaprenol L-rhamnosyltransferase